MREKGEAMKKRILCVLLLNKGQVFFLTNF